MARRTIGLRASVTSETNGARRRFDQAEDVQPRYDSSVTDRENGHVFLKDDTNWRRAANKTGPPTRRHSLSFFQRLWWYFPAASICHFPVWHESFLICRKKVAPGMMCPTDSCTDHEWF